MRLSVPVYHLKRQAKLLSRRDRVPLHQALDRVAAGEGFASWSLLAAKAGEATPAGSLLAQLAPGDLVLVGARPGQGKTLMSLELAVEAMKSGRHSVFFTLEYTHTDILRRFRVIGVEPALSTACSNSTIRTPSVPTTSSASSGQRLAGRWQL